MLGGLALCVLGVFTVDVLNTELESVAHMASYFVHGPGAEILVIGAFALGVVALAVAIASAPFTVGGWLGRSLLGAFAVAMAVAAIVPVDPVGHWEEPLTAAAAVHGLAGWTAFLSFPVGAAARPRASVFGTDADPDVWTEAAALGRSLIRNHPLVDGNKRLGWVAMRAFLGLNVVPPVRADVDEAERFVIDVASGDLDEVAEIAKRLRALAE